MGNLYSHVGLKYPLTVLHCILQVACSGSRLFILSYAFSHLPDRGSLPTRASPIPGRTPWASSNRVHWNASGEFATFATAAPSAWEANAAAAPRAQASATKSPKRHVRGAGKEREREEDLAWQGGWTYYTRILQGVSINNSS